MVEFKIKESAQSGFASAAEYETHRPSYPREAVEELLQKLEISGKEGAKIADLAAGTGKFTEILSSRPERYDIVAIEPHDAMRAQLEQKHLAGVRVIKGQAENLADIPDGSLAAVVAAQVSFRCNSSNFTVRKIRFVDQTGRHFIGAYDTGGSHRDREQLA